MTKSTNLTERNLRQLTGTENRHRHGLVADIFYTDGAKFVAEERGAYWLLDSIAICQRFEKSATLTCGDGNDNIIYTQHIEFTDFPLEEITLWFANNTIGLPSGHWIVKWGMWAP
jgi:hypothetical protein